MILHQIYEDKDMQMLWKNYQKKFDYAIDYSWSIVMESIISLYKSISIFP